VVEAGGGVTHFYKKVGLKVITEGLKGREGIG
jgi:hypothetical protein